MNAVQANVDRFSGFADVYDRARPRPPVALRELLIRYAGGKKPALVVDLGSGTGLSTRFWDTFAGHIIGVEPNDDMRARAMRPGDAFEYVAGTSADTGLPDACADLVTVSQALHWMPPEATFAEAARILRPGGVFAAYDCDWPPVTDWEVERAFRQLQRRVSELERGCDASREVTRWAKAEHLSRMEASGCFRHVREALLHSEEIGDARRLVDLLRSQGSVAGLLRAGRSEAELGLDAFAALARERLGEGAVPLVFCYRVRVGVR